VKRTKAFGKHESFESLQRWFPNAFDAFLTLLILNFQFFPTERVFLPHLGLVGL